MKQSFVDKTFRNGSQELIDTANSIITTYQSKGYRLTLRQLYYQFISRDLLPNSEKSYSKLGRVISEGRLAGLIDWDAIEDRVRVPRIPQEFENIQELVDVAIKAYRLPRWKNQKNYIELWVEKDALAGVLQPLASRYHVTMMVNRGYSSQSAMYEAGNRFIDARQKHEACHLLYLGDHDPSGEDMVRDIRDRLEMFGAKLEVDKLALTMDQIEQYNPPPNPAKMTDSRATGYVALHGSSSWEVDALPPDVLSNLIEGAIENLLDEELMNKVKEKEQVDKLRLQEVVKDI